MKITLMGLVALGLATCLTPQANAAGFFIQEQSVSGLGSAFSGSAAMPRDASILFFNPAGMTYLEGQHGNVGLHLIAPFSDVDDTGTSNAAIGQPTGGDTDNPYGVEPVPNAYYTHQLDSRNWIGIGLSAPFGLKNEYDEDYFARFDSTSTELKTINIQPSFAHKVTDRLSVGGGVDIQYADAVLESAVFVGAGTAGQSKLEGDDISFGYNLGMMYEVNDRTRVGLHYRSQVNHKLDGDISIEGTGTAADGSSSGEANLNLPEILNFSVAHNLNDRWTMLAGATWFGWSNFERITANAENDIYDNNVQQNYQNTLAFNLGAEYAYSPEWTFRGGVQYDETPTQDGSRSTRTPDGDRIWVSGGTTYKMDDRWSFDLAATYINVGEEDISLTRNTGSNIEAENNGHVGILALGLNYKF